MNRKRLDDGTRKGFLRERVTLAKGETCPCAASTKKLWIGPGAFERTTFPDGARCDTALAGGARITYADMVDENPSNALPARLTGSTEDALQDEARKVLFAYLDKLNAPHVVLDAARVIADPDPSWRRPPREPERDWSATFDEREAANGGATSVSVAVTLTLCVTTGGRPDGGDDFLRGLLDEARVQIEQAVEKKNRAPGDIVATWEVLDIDG